MTWQAAAKAGAVFTAKSARNVAEKWTAADDGMPFDDLVVTDPEMPFRAMKAMVENDEAQMTAFIHSAAKRMLPFADVTETDLPEVVNNFVKNRSGETLPPSSPLLTCSRQSSVG